VSHKPFKKTPRNFDRIVAAPVKNIPLHHGFGGMGIAPGLLDSILRLGFVEPTPVQKRSIPIGLEGKDLIAIAQTGTGKTMAFGIPMIQRLAQVKGRGLVLLPTRELAIQVDEAIMSVGRTLGLKTALLIGGVPIFAQKAMLAQKPRLLIATPGRLIDHLDHHHFNLFDVKILVLDEADRMLDMGFAPQINQILEMLPRDRQTSLFSATMPSEIMKIAKKHMQLPIQVEISPSGTTVDKVQQEVYFVNREAKTRLLEVVLSQCPGPVLTFTRTKHGAHKLTRQVKAMGHAAAEIHSDRSLPQRREALEGFKSGKYRVLIATDIAARGIDVSGIEVVVNYDLPSNTEDYVHRIGRTARAGMDGRAVSFATFDQKGEVKDIERLIRSALPVSAVPKLPPERRVSQPPVESGRPQRQSHAAPHPQPNKPMPEFGRSKSTGFGPRKRMKRM
jgi:ATP-dependent RNA helicase RhlE